MKHRHRHLDDDALLECYVREAQEGERRPARRETTPAAMSGCHDCTRRYRGLLEVLAQVQADARADADRVFTEERLTEQREAILRRLAEGRHRARVLPFPSSGPAVPAVRSARRWVAAAAAAGLVIGVTAGRLVNFQPRSQGVVAELFTSARSAADPSVPPMDARIGPNEEAFLLEIDAALDGPTVAELQAIDALTPRIADIAMSTR